MLHKFGEFLPDDKFEKRVDAWLQDTPGLSRQLWRAWLAKYYAWKRPSLSVWGAAHGVGKTSLAASGPAVSYLTGGSISAYIAGAAFAGIFVGHSVVNFLGAKASRKPDSTPEISVMMVRIGDMLAATKVRQGSEADRRDSIRALLGMIEMFALQITGLSKGEIAVSVARYVGNSSHDMRIECRNPGNERPVRGFDGRDFLGHRACQAGKTPRVVHDLKGFGKKGMSSPTQSKVAYRSILIFPLVGVRNGHERVIGFLSIDATRPYAFYGSRGNDMIVHCQPLVNHIQAIL